jgi:DNA excision repair protein ERCC-3
LNAGDDAVGLEQLEEDSDEIALKSARRSQGSMSAMSGAKGMVYMEYRCVRYPLYLPDTSVPCANTSQSYIQTIL